ncbi:MAG: hypothetical protein KDA57_14070 [Planctomycetales bacterium]|nr:hypothetical protein [Planctomycetales bacterium]
MSGLKIFKEILELAFGVGIIGFALAFDALDPWIAALGGGLVLWAVYEISKELRDNSKTGEVADMAAERNRILQGK